MSGLWTGGEGGGLYPAHPVRTIREDHRTGPRGRMLDMRYVIVMN